jgi:hypothetical protein
MRSMFAVFVEQTLTDTKDDRAAFFVHGIACAIHSLRIVSFYDNCEVTSDQVCLRSRLDRQVAAFPWIPFFNGTR